MLNNKELQTNFSDFTISNLIHFYKELATYYNYYLQFSLNNYLNDNKLNLNLKNNITTFLNEYLKLNNEINNKENSFIFVDFIKLNDLILQNFSQFNHDTFIYNKVDAKFIVNELKDAINTKTPFNVNKYEFDKDKMLLTINTYHIDFNNDKLSFSSNATSYIDLRYYYALITYNNVLDNYYKQFYNIHGIEIYHVSLQDKQIILSHKIPTNIYLTNYFIDKINALLPEFWHCEILNIDNISNINLIFTLNSNEITLNTLSKLDDYLVNLTNITNLFHLLFNEDNGKYKLLYNYSHFNLHQLDEYQEEILNLASKKIATTILDNKYFKDEITKIKNLFELKVNDFVLLLTNLNN